MSSLGFLSGELDREQRRLAELNSALIDLEAHALGFSEAFELQPQGLDASRSVLLNFAEALTAALQASTPDPDLQGLVEVLRSGSKSDQDWIDDLRMVRAELSRSATTSQEVRGIINAIIGSLDTKFARDLRQMYGRR
ncbi:MAG: hypothetical protein ACJ8GN_19615 [Longimicrobiaceae bacterium]